MAEQDPMCRGQAEPPARFREPTAGSRYLGMDVGSESIKLAEVIRGRDGLRVGRCEWVEHGKRPGPVLRRVLEGWDWPQVRGATVTGRLSRQIQLPQVPTKQALARGYRHGFGAAPATLVSIGSHGFSVLELRSSGLDIFRENSRCSQGTGNFLRQLVERFSLTIEEASRVAATVDRAASLSGRCPVILKTDMTHLANKGEDRARILAGLFDAVCENVLVLVKPGVSPSPVVLAGGVSRSERIQKTFRRLLDRLGLEAKCLPGDQALFLEAIGCALMAADTTGPVPALDALLAPASEAHLERVPPLAAARSQVRRMVPAPALARNGASAPIILGLDIGSTGSKVVALEAETKEIVWESYRPTLGDPVGASQELVRRFVEAPVSSHPVKAFGVTGSGREIAGSLLTTCYGKEAVFVLNEIVAHAEGALHYDPRVDTIFEIGGQDAKYIRLDAGRVVDCAMNEACSAGTGSFIEEQGRKFPGIRDVVQLGEEALAAPAGVSLGQHCSVFMAEVIDEAVGAGLEPRVIMAGLYDSVIQNYLNRVKGCRSVGEVIFCQGMPFSSDALAAAVARQTGSEVIVPPNPGTVGALGIALLARRQLEWSARPPLRVERYLAAAVQQKDTFICKATVGCGAPGNRCRIDRLWTEVEGERQCFTWGGGCALHDKGTHKRKLPDLAPDPFREREQLLAGVLDRCANRGDRPRVALTDEFALKGLFPFFAAYAHLLGFDLVVARGAEQGVLKQGIQGANVPFCAPMQLYHGWISRLTESEAEYFFLPMLRQLPRINGEPDAVTCPIVQASPDICRLDLKRRIRGQVIHPTIDIGYGNLESAEFQASCRAMAVALGVSGGGWREAYRGALIVQREFEAGCGLVGERALAYSREHDLASVIVLGRPYTIYNTVLNSNVPAILREQGALAIPVDCYPVAEDQPMFSGMYWGYGQLILRAAHQIRRTPGVYSLYCSNYSCGPDSFSLHFYSYIMQGKPFAIIETDGHSGDAGTKTRVEAFLHCVAQDRSARVQKAPTDFRRVAPQGENLEQIRRRGERLLVPRMGPASDVLVACLRGMRLAAETLPPPGREALQRGRRYTSGKECLPMCLTLGSLLQRLEDETDTTRRFALLMPTTCGPCRFGVYHLLNRLTLERLGWRDRVRIWSPVDDDYFKELSTSLMAVLYAGVMAADNLLRALLDVRPTETRAGAAEAVYREFFQRLTARVEQVSAAPPSVPGLLGEVITGRLFGLAPLLEAAAEGFAAIRGTADRPTVLLAGEIYLRCDPAANGYLVEKLEERGLRVHLAPFHEWLEYCEAIRWETGTAGGLSDRLSHWVQHRTQRIAHGILGQRLGWPQPVAIEETLEAAEPYVCSELRGEAILTVGGPVALWQRGEIDGVVSVGPLECMPNKIAEAQFYHVTEQEGLPTLSLSLNGDPMDPTPLDEFAFEVRSRFGRRNRGPSNRASCCIARERGT